MYFRIHYYTNVRHIIDVTEDDSIILVVDDQQVNRGIAMTILSAAGWDVDEAESGAAAVSAVARRRYALVLMDIEMPGQNGFDATRAIRDAGGYGAAVPIIAFTALPREEVVGRIDSTGMDGLIIKPYTAEALIAAVEPWRPAGAGQTVARLATIFGEKEISGLLARFRQQLGEALAAPDTAGERRARAHQIAGLAGTLGFPDVSRAWLDVAGGSESAWAGATIAARKAIVALTPRPFARRAS